MHISETSPDSRHEKLVLIVLDFLGKTYVKNGVIREFLGAKVTPELFCSLGFCEILLDDKP